MTEKTIEDEARVNFTGNALATERFTKSTIDHGLTCNRRRTKGVNGYGDEIGAEGKKSYHQEVVKASKLAKGLVEQFGVGLDSRYADRLKALEQAASEL
jgi:hypothetical protein